MAGEDLSAVPLDELQKEFVETAHAFAALSDRRTLLAAEIQSRQTMASARSRVETLSVQERDAMRQVLSEDGDVSDEVARLEMKR